MAGGQFITFKGNTCYESDKNGHSVCNGSLLFHPELSSDLLIYTGNCYFGNSSFRFKKDKSLLNVYAPSGWVYVYKRTTPPAGVETCSLIKSKQKNSGSSNSGVGQPTYIPVSVYSDVPTGNTSVQRGNTPSTPSKKWRTVTREEMCPQCYSTGKCSTCAGKGWYYNPYGSGTLVCPNCHNHDGKCTKCGGTGKITKTEQVYE